MLLCLLAVLSALLPLPGCPARAEELLSGVRTNVVSADAELNGPEAAAVTDFGVRLFQGSLKDGEPL